MSCNKATSPIDIKNNNNILNCSGKCNLKFDYTASHIIATNKKNYILLAQYVVYLFPYNNVLFESLTSLTMKSSRN